MQADQDDALRNYTRFWNNQPFNSMSLNANCAIVHTTYEDGTDYFEMSTHNILTPGNHPQEIIQDETGHVFYLQQATYDVKLSADSWTSLLSQFVSEAARTAVDVPTSLQVQTLVTFYNYIIYWNIT